MTAYETITDELVEALSNYIELCDSGDAEFSIKGFGEYLQANYPL